MKGALLSTPDHTENKDRRSANFVSETLLRDVLTELRAIRVALERQRRPAATLDREDRKRLAAMLPALGAVYGPDEFTSRDLVEDERPAVQLVVNGFSVKQLSKLFSRADGIPIAGRLVQRQGVELPKAWRVFKTVSKPAAAPAYRLY